MISKQHVEAKTLTKEITDDKKGEQFRFFIANNIPKSKQ